MHRHRQTPGQHSGTMQYLLVSEQNKTQFTSQSAMDQCILRSGRVYHEVVDFNVLRYQFTLCHHVHTISQTLGEGPYTQSRRITGSNISSDFLFVCPWWLLLCHNNNNDNNDNNDTSSSGSTATPPTIMFTPEPMDKDI
ncbi:hypothetical protein EYF80_026033 [Liparis tanakae]|uniref:Uncharacterized protein n=1 Tax=Liparis tanakae TaxID=230148 RepID=A0A4Z2HDB9_9TELE|nr:hypothetical protein EYF80_026033 [Liparis tanakae]